MGADYTIYCKCCKEEVSSFYITRNYNQMFPFWMLHNHIEECYEKDKRRPFIPYIEYQFLLKTIRKTLHYYCKGTIYNHKKWEEKAKNHPEHKKMRGWETNKYTVIMALIRYYWHLKRYPFDRYEWSCWY